MRFQPVKCNMMQLTKKHNKIQASYTLEGTVLEYVESLKYLRVTIDHTILVLPLRLSFKSTKNKDLSAFILHESESIKVFTISHVHLFVVGF